MIPDASQELTWLERNPQVLKGIQRGIERETLRINKDGSLAKTRHPEILGAPLTHKWITTDFAESLLEFVTPVDDNIDRMLIIMRDIHRYTARHLGDERMWPLSIPCYITQDQEIELAQYGTSNIGRLKTLYREGLKNRYGAIMQTICGIHYNFSLPEAFWQAKHCEMNKEAISAGYFRLIRNYYRFGWVIPYLFGSSPAVYSSFLKGRTSTLPFEKTDCDVYYLPYSTSLRLSDLGYSNNRLQKNLGITYNTLHEYIAGLKRATKTPSQEYQKIGINKNGKRLQINSNILQIESELYAPIRPKRVTYNDEALSDALQKDGIEYIEVRSLDINSFSPIGINKKQIYFLDLFMIWCVLADSPEMSSDELFYAYMNWNRVILEGRKPGLALKTIDCKTKQYPLQKVGKDLFRDLKRVAQTLDAISTNNKKEYQKVCDELVNYFDDPEMTFSARILRPMIDRGIISTGNFLAEEYFNILRNEPLEILSETDFATEREASIMRQRKIEETDGETFEMFLEKRS